MASGNYSHAEGSGTSGSGFASHSEGNLTLASGWVSHAEGSETTASLSYSHAEGLETTASGYAAHSEGEGTAASGTYSHSEGIETTASGYASHAQNNRTIAQRASQTVIGKYNLADTGGTGVGTLGNYAFIIGNGTSDSARSNAFTVDWNGNAEVANSLQVGSGNLTASFSASNKTLTNDSTYITSGTLTIYRRGNMCTIAGSVDTSAVGSSWTTVGTILSGYRPLARMFVSDTAGNLYQILPTGEFQARNLTAGTKYFGFCYVAE